MGSPSSRRASSKAGSSSDTAASWGRNSLACSSRRSIFRPAVRAATRTPSSRHTSRACRPMEPVEPRREIVFVIALSPFVYRRLNSLALHSSMPNSST